MTNWNFSKQTFCSVIFEPGGKTYYYISDDASINIDDQVLVPAGADDHTTVVQVKRIEFFDEKNAPMEVGKVKHIIRKCHKDEYVDIFASNCQMVFCPLLQMKIDRDKCIEQIYMNEEKADLALGDKSNKYKEICRSCIYHISPEAPRMKISVKFQELDEDEQDCVDRYGHDATIHIETHNGKKYRFRAENCWIEGLESIHLKGYQLYYFQKKVTSTYDLAGIFYFLDRGGDAFPEIVFPVFNFICDRITIIQLIEELKKSKTIAAKRLQDIDPTLVDHTQVLSILKPVIPSFSPETLKPYIAFAEEVADLNEIASIDIDIF